VRHMHSALAQELVSQSPEPVDLSNLQTAADSMWWNTRLVQDSLIAVHDLTGLPWWVTIIASTVALKTILLPVSISAVRNQLNMMVAKPHLDQVTNAYKKNPAGTDQTELAQKMSQVFVDFKCHPLKTLMLGFSQAPIFMSVFFALRSESVPLRMPGIEDGGALWFKDLTIADPTGILPVFSTATFIAILHVWLCIASPDLIQLGVDTENDNAMAKKVRYAMTAVIALTTPVMMQFQSVSTLSRLPKLDRLCLCFGSPIRSTHSLRTDSFD